ncbi:MAG: hypothetical protein QME12_02540 [Nanoarchaeota archaeon]|nr:hypothetical protein [Nanoarchaeota archaeon]
MKKAILLLLAFLVSVSFAYAANGCAEKTKAGEWCVYTSEDNVEAGAKFTPTICEQTSYCKIGCCYSSDEGRCFRNTPRAACTAEGATWNQDAMCGIGQCTKGCCVLGDQAFFVTEVKCKQTASMYPEVQMVYNKDIKSEAECVASAKSQELGCCVKEDGCGFMARASCGVSEEPIAAGDNTTKKAAAGFYKDMLCSNDQLNCGCAKQKTTGCVGEDVYWFDSCGNRENIYNSDKRASYNNGYVLKESESCTGSAGDVNCGNCDYPAGNVCGADTKKKMEVGNYICIGLGCKETYKDDVSPNANGRSKKNGESWCVFDSMPGLARDLVGSRHYRHLCVNGEEMVETCKDFREEICVQGKMGESALRNLDALRQLFGEGDYVEAGCRDNRHENCFACNQYLSEQEKTSGLTETIIEKRKECCKNEYLRDCYWLPSVTAGAEKGLDGTCVPQIPPGLKFWGDASQSERAVTASTDPAAQTSTPSSAADQKCGQASTECIVTYQMRGLERLMGKFGNVLRYALLISPQESGGWKIVKNEQCTKKDWVIAGNQICKSIGDCGAYYNIQGRSTLGGYLNSLWDERDYGIDGRARKLKTDDIGNYKSLLTRKEGEVPGFLENGGDWWIGVTTTLFLFTDTGGKFLEGATGIMGAIPGVGAGIAMPLQGISAAVGGLRNVFGLGKQAASWSAESLTKAGVALPEGVSLPAVGQTVNVESLMGGTADSIRATALESASVGGVSQETLETFGRARIRRLGGDVAGQTPEKILEAGQNEWADQSVGLAKDNAAEKMQALQAQGVVSEQGVVQAPSSGFSSFMGYVQGYMWVRQIAQLVDLIATKNVDETYTITCQPWEQPAGGDDCEKCNEPMKPCSEYKCKSLGAVCTLVNQGTSNESCVAMDVNDVNSPIITPWREILTPPYELEEVTKAGNPGYKIKGKIPPFKPVIVGIKLDEPAACKYSVEPGVKFENMPGTFGSSLLLYEQLITFTLPSELAQQNATRANKGEYSMYIRCKDANNNQNERDYFIKFQIDDSPDLTPPSIRFTSMRNDGYVAAATTEIDFSIYVDEYADCKWSRRDTEFEQMEKSFNCKNTMFGQSSIYAGTFECSTRLENLTKTANMFFIRCSDRPGMENTTRNTMSESVPFKITGSDALNITSISPSGDLFTKDATLKVQTVKGAEAGKANCGYSTTDVLFSNMILFAKTGETSHEQAFTELDKGDYTYYVSCMDKAGNEARKSTSFKVTVDSMPPMLTSVYINSAFGLLHLEFDEECTCEYSTEASSFAFGEGTPLGNANMKVHETQITGNTYYVKCKDRFDNKGDYRIFKETASSIEDFFF